MFNVFLCVINKVNQFCEEIVFKNCFLYKKAHFSIKNGELHIFWGEWEIKIKFIFFGGMGIGWTEDLQII